MRLRRACGLIVMATLIGIGSAVAQETAKMSPTPTALRDVLRARAEAMKTFQAVVVLTTGPGKDVEEIVQNRRQYADWVDKAHPEYAKENEQFRRRIELQLKMPTNVYRYAYTSDAAGRIRVQTLPDAARQNAPQEGSTRLHLFNGSEWTIYNEGTDKRTGERFAGMTIQSQDRENFSWLEIARGLGIFLRGRYRGDSLNFEISARSDAVQRLDWPDLLRNIPEGGSRVETSVPPGRSTPGPSLILESKPFRDTGKGLFRLQVWFDPDRGYAPCAMTASELQPAGRNTWDFLPDYTVEWSDPAETKATVIFRSCRIRFYEHHGIVDDDAPIAEWRQMAYESGNYEYLFANIHVDDPVDSGKFDVQPVAGTNVIDEPKGFVYVVGKAGEQLEKTALSERDRAPADATQSKPGLQWRTIFIIFNILFLLALVSYWAITRRRGTKQQ